MKYSFIFIFLILSSFCLFGQDKGVDPDVSLSELSVLDDKILKPGPDLPANLQGKIRFPNAFRWNRSGPTGGYWSENHSDDYIFRPISVNVAAYRLQIYSRWGLLIYDSSDIHKGWDGYVDNGDLAIQGVYIWKASGKFNDGSAFNKAGDVTFLY